MLKLVLGRAGSGKTYTVLQTLRDAVEHGDATRCIWLVPEQFSFETERMLLREIGPQATFQIKVYSFTRLAEMVAKECGETGGRTMDEPTRVLLMSEALSQVSDRLQLYRRRSIRETQVQTMLRFVEECKQGGISPSMLESAAMQTKGVLRRKTQDLSCILGAYEALAAQAYVDPQDALSALCDQLPTCRSLQHTAIFVDGFKGFTAEELRVLDGLMRVADTMTVTLPTDTLQDDGDKTQLFYFPTHTAAQLTRIAKDRHIPIAPPVYLTENYRHRTEGLRHLENALLRSDQTPYEESVSEVTVTKYGNVHRECEGVARTIRRLLREGMRCRDIAIVARSLQEYDGVLDVLLDAAGVPYYRDARESIQNDTLTVTLLTALSCVLNRFRAENVLRLVKTELLGFSARSTAMMENYVYMWNIQGNTWRDEWKDHPDGFSLKADEKTEARRHYLNILRRRVMRPLLRLEEELRPNDTITGEAFARALYNYLTEARVDRMVRLQVARLERAGETDAADRADRLWDTMMRLLDTFAATLGTVKGTAAHFAELFRQITAVADLGAISQQMDAVQIGTADRMRFSAPRVVFVLGANEGTFPATPSHTGVLSDRERSTLRNLDLPLSEAAEGQIAEERFFVYTALTAPSERLYVSFVTGSLREDETKKRQPSLIVQEIERILPQCTHETGHHTDVGEAEYAEEMLTQYAAEARHPTKRSETLRYVLSQDPCLARKIEQIGRIRTPSQRRFETPEAAKRLFGDRMVLSSTQVNNFYNCRFQYFCEYGLRISENKPAQLDVLEIGKILHYIVEHQVPTYVQNGVKTVTKAQVYQDAARLIKQYVAETMGGLENKSSRFLHILQLLERKAGCLLWHVLCDLRQSRFVPIDYELPITDNVSADGIPPAELTLPDGSRVCMVGKVDRVDIFRQGDTSYVRIIDYKSRTVDFSLSDVLQGLKLQMLIYMNTIWQNGTERYGAVTPAGVLYMPAALPILNAEDIEPTEKEEAQMRAVRMDGLLLDNPEVIAAMEEDIQGIFIPAKLNKDGGFNKAQSKVATLKQMGVLKRRIDKLLCDMAQALRDGEIGVLPASKNKKQLPEPCKYCDYRAVCGYEMGDEVREILSYGRTNRVLEMLEEETV